MSNLPPVFRCDPLKLKLQISSCADNYRAVNKGLEGAKPGARGPLADRIARLGPCRDCKTGKIHAETGKARNGLRLEVLQAPSSAPVPPRPALPPPPPTPVQAPRARLPLHDRHDEEDAPMPRQRPTIIPPKSERLARLIVLVGQFREGTGRRGGRGGGFPAEIVDLACRAHLEDGVPVRLIAQLAALNQFSIFEWLRKRKQAAGSALDEVVGTASRKRPPMPVEEPEAAEEASPPASNTDNEDEDEDEDAERGEEPAVAHVGSEATTPEQLQRLSDDASKAITEEGGRIRAALAFDHLARICGATVAPEAPLPTTLDDFIDLCDRAGLPYRHARAVVQIVTHHLDGTPASLAEVRALLERVASRKAAA